MADLERAMSNPGASPKPSRRSRSPQKRNQRSRTPERKTEEKKRDRPEYPFLVSWPFKFLVVIRPNFIVEEEKGEVEFLRMSNVAGKDRLKRSRDRAISNFFPLNLAPGKMYLFSIVGGAPAKTEKDYFFKLKPFRKDLYEHFGLWALFGSSLFTTHKHPDVVNTGDVYSLGDFELRLQTVKDNTSPDFIPLLGKCIMQMMQNSKHVYEDRKLNGDRVMFLSYEKSRRMKIEVGAPRGRGRGRGGRGGRYDRGGHESPSRLADMFNNLTAYPGFVFKLAATSQAFGFRLETRWNRVSTHDVGKFLDEIENSSSRERRAALESLVRRKIMKSWRDQDFLGERISGIEMDMDINSSFECFNKKLGRKEQVTYQQFYEQRYNVRLRRRGKGMIRVDPLERDLKAFQEGRWKKKWEPKPNYYPPELCYLVGQTTAMAANQSLRNNWIRQVAVQPRTRIENMQTFVRDFLSSRVEKFRQSERFANAAKVIKSIATKAQEVDQYSVKDPNVILSKNSRETSVRAGDLMREWRNAGFFESSCTKSRGKWIILHGRRDSRAAEDVWSNIRRFSQTQGVRRLDEPRMEEMRLWSESEISDILEKNGGRRLWMVVAVLPERNNEEAYRALKNACWLAGIPCQGVRGSNLGRRAGPVVGGVWKQMNHKTGYAVWKPDFKSLNLSNIDFERENVMVAGLDVNHGLSEYEAATNESICGFVFSVSKDLTQYGHFQAEQKMRSEEVSSLTELVTKAFEEYKQKNRAYPDRLIFFRDGVGDSQADTILKNEIIRIRAAFSGLGVNTKLTFIFTTKRINVMFWNNGRDSLRPGTVVNSGVTRTDRWDFFMVTSRSPKGKCAHPVRYVILVDENKFSHGEMYSFIYLLCGMYFNWPGVIRLPAPLMHAHKSAYMFGEIWNIHGKDKMHNAMQFQQFWV